MRWENREKILNMSAEERKNRRLAILRKYQAGATAGQLSLEYDCSPQTIYQILRREDYTPHYFGQRDRDVKRLETGVLKLKELFAEDQPKADDSAGLLSLLIAAREIVRSF